MATPDMDLKINGSDTTLFVGTFGSMTETASLR